MVVSRFICFMLLCFSGIATAQTDDPFAGALIVTLEEFDEAPFEQEMVLLTIKGFYPRNITLEKLHRPALQDLGWMELGIDSWDETVFEGRRVSGFTRMMAIFPQKSGDITVGSFTHKLTFATRSGGREMRDFTSDPVTLRVRAKPAGVTWWLPARDLQITDSWANSPDQLGPGEVAERTVTLSAAGVTPDQLPPAPDMRAAGLMIFTDPEERKHIITPKGPISQVTWHWKMRPATSKPALIDPVTIPWFDSVAREMREVELKQQRVAVSGTEIIGHWEGGEVNASGGLGRFVFMIATGLSIGLALVIPGFTTATRANFTQTLRRLRPNPVVADLNAAASAGDFQAFRSISKTLLGDAQGASPERVLVEKTLQEIDEHLYGMNVPTPDIDLRKLAKLVLRFAKT